MDKREVDELLRRSGWCAVEQFTGAAFVISITVGGGVFVLLKFGIVGAIFLVLFLWNAFALSRA